MATKHNKNKEPLLQSTLTELQKALDEWNAVTPIQQPEDSSPSPHNDSLTDIKKKTQDILKKLSEQIKELDL